MYLCGLKHKDKTTMRLTKFFLLLLFLLPALHLKADYALTDTVALQHVESHKFQKVKGLHSVEFRFAGDLPKVTEAVYSNVTAWADSLLCFGLEQKPAATNAPSLKKMVAAHQKVFIKNSKAEISEIDKQMRKEGNRHRISYSYDMTISVVYETNRFITFSAETYFYTGGAHGGQALVYATFRKDTGKLLTWEDLFLKKKMPALRGLVVDGLQDFFGVPTYSDLKTRLIFDQEYSRKNFPLPAGTPGLLKDGLRVQYASYEIAPYAAGRPMAVISYSKLKGFWTEEAKWLWK